MKYFICTEFIEGSQGKWLWKTPPTIDLISIGIKAEDGREFYAISKDFNLKEAWNRHDTKYAEVTRLVDARGEQYDVLTYIKETENVIEWKKQHPGFTYNKSKGEIYKEYWIRDNVLNPIWEELINKEFAVDILAGLDNPFTYKGLKYLINKYGKTNKQIAEEIIEFVYNKETILYNHKNCTINDIGEVKSNIEFYGYYADYDWVVFCWLFGRMINLPKGFPMYCNDLKQTMDEKAKLIPWSYDIKHGIRAIKLYETFPKQSSEHNALDDAKWTFELYKFLKEL